MSGAVPKEEIELKTNVDDDGVIITNRQISQQTNRQIKLHIQNNFKAQRLTLCYGVVCGVYKTCCKTEDGRVARTRVLKQAAAAESQEARVDGLTHGSYDTRHL